MIYFTVRLLQAFILLCIHFKKESLELLQRSKKEHFKTDNTTVDFLTD
jgi:hypothetical protein